MLNPALDLEAGEGRLRPEGDDWDSGLGVAGEEASDDLRCGSYDASLLRWIRSDGVSPVVG